MRRSSSALYYAQLHVEVPNGAWRQAQLGLKFGGVGLRSVSLHAAAAFIASLSSSGFGSIHLQQAVVAFNSQVLQCHLSYIHSGLSHSYPEGFVWNDRGPTFLHLVGVFLSCQQSLSPVSGSPSFFLLAISGPFNWFGLAPQIQ